MLNLRMAAFGLSALLLATAGVPARADDKAGRPFGIAKRTPWTTSRVTGSPEPPHPYRVERAFPKLTFNNPLLLTTAPGLNRFFVGEQAGKLFSFPIKQDCAKADLFLDLTKELHSWDPAKVKGVAAVYGLVFHPQFAKNRTCYVCYVLDGKTPQPLADGSRVSRFTVTDTDPPRIDPKSEQIVLTFLAGGHNGGDLHFGNDGYLYITTGDAADPNPPDRLNTGQDLSDLLSSILRIDVDHADNGKAYSIPPDNPFVKTPGARPEIWAYGFRNPWRMSFDRPTGDLWVGDVGWELWEMVYRVQRGGNYGWSVMEGRQPVHPEGKVGPTPILPPALDFPHTEAASITGGYVYRGKKLPELQGAYICGDWVTRKLWATKFDGDRIVWHKEIAYGGQRVVAFGLDPEGELYFVNHDDVGTIHYLVPNEAAKQHRGDFPRKLSETGLFTSVQAHTPAPGVVPFSINAEQWQDHATAERFVALPGESGITVHEKPVPIPGGFYSGQIFFPKDGVLARTVSIEMERGKPESRRRLETQLLHYDGIGWHGYSYLWNEAQTDAELVPAAGLDKSLTVIDREAPGGKRRQTWHVPSRAECMTCHNPWAGYALAFSLPQLDRSHDYGGVTDNQLRALFHVGILQPATKEAKERLINTEETRAKAAETTVPSHLVDPYGDRADVELRARSYLHANCSHCHQFGAGGTADLQLRFDVPLKEMKIVDVRPVQGTFEIADARIVAPRDPYRSVLYYRMSKTGRGRMPHIGSEIVDQRGAAVIRLWIAGLDADYPQGEEERILTERPAGTEIDARTVDRLLATTRGALLLATQMGEGACREAERKLIIARGAARPEPQIRDLFERFLPDEQRVKRLGPIVRPEALLALKGDAARGKEIFFRQAMQCATCHKAGGTGGSVGPDLSQIGKKYTKALILENIVEPSKTIDPQYVTYVVETAAGQILTGVLVRRDDREVVLRDATDKELHVPAKEVAGLVAAKKSIMPEQLLRDLTAEQAADLLEFLASLR